MVDLACLFAARPGVKPTLVLTPAIAALVRPTLDRSAAAGRPVGILLFPFPSVGLPDGVENLATAPASESWRVYKAVDLAQTAHDEILHRHRPDAVVADIPYWWTTAIAADLGIPRVTFHAVGVFPQLVMNNLFRCRSGIQDRQVVAVPDLPGRPIEIPRSELPEFLLEENHMSDTWDRMKEAQLTCHGVVVNTFYGFEPEYCNDYRRVDARRAWFVGPVALASCGGVERGGGTAAKEDGDRCMTWLDTREDGSVLFVCFGSWCHFTVAQLREMAAGLEASGQPGGEGVGAAGGHPGPQGGGGVPEPLRVELGSGSGHGGEADADVAAGVRAVHQREAGGGGGGGREAGVGGAAERAEHEKMVVPGEAIARAALSGFMKAGGDGKEKGHGAVSGGEGGGGKGRIIAPGSR
ncbi:hypothetical protein BHM03_00026986 [Ensete ventricosum]|nr:hypothetical protein BHM03_00026986 [Ensete ventricosum]